jgi:hypothetical protein
MKTKTSIAVLVTITIVGAIYFMIKSSNLANQLNKIEEEHSLLSKQLQDYEALVHIDSMLLKGDYETALNSYEQSLKFHQENNLGIPVRIALAEKLRYDVRNNKNLNKNNSDNADSLTTSLASATKEIRKFDSINFTLEKTKVQLSHLRSQLKEKSFGEYLQFKSKKGNQMHYVGQVKHGKANGYGIALLDSGSRYEGQWKDNERQGEGTFYWADGQYYVGAFDGDKRNGYGTYYWPNGEKYTGQWKDDKRNGEGKFFGSDGDVVTGGKWNDDELIEVDEKRRR